VWSREETLTALVAEALDEEALIDAAEFEGAKVGPGLILLIYVTDRGGRRARRSSLWRQTHGRWRLLHHQGTLLPSP
jgi:hypothetical protein